MEVARRKTNAMECTERGNVLFDKDDYEAAMEEYDAALKSVPSHMEVRKMGLEGEGGEDGESKAVTQRSRISFV